MKNFLIPLWKKAPFVRIFVPFTGGIILRHHFAFSCIPLWVLFSGSMIAVLMYSFASLPFRFKHQLLAGIMLNVALMALGGLSRHHHEIPFDANSLAKQDFFIATVSEPFAEKKSSWKALSELDSPKVNMIMYLIKDSSMILPGYGDKIGFVKSPREIENFSLHGDFNYKKYCALKNIHVQVFLRPFEFVVLRQGDTNTVQGLLFRMQNRIVSMLRRWIKSEKEAGLAEALLIGYKNDLDKNLMRSYSDTGVIHVVAISGLHLGLIYALLKIACIPLNRKWLRWLKPWIILSGLWLFSLLAGGSASIIRSAVMFSFIVIGEHCARRHNIINNLAASAFFLLFYDPNWLWDLGFQLSYLALLGIVLFVKPLTNILVFKNKAAGAVWKINAVTLSATLLTTPLTIFYFHQFPNLFLITNFIAVPLSSIILMGEILLCVFASVPVIAEPLGLLLTGLIRFMNETVVFIERLPFASVGDLNINIMQLLLIYAILFYLCKIFRLPH